MHVLVIPSEEYVPSYAPLAGIFQRHQIAALIPSREYRIGVVSVSLEYSIPMIIKAMLFNIAHRPVTNDLDGTTVGGLFSLLTRKIFSPEKFISEDKIDNIEVVRIRGFYYMPPSPRTDYFGWMKAGKIAVDYYIRKYGKPDIIHAHNALNAGLLADELNRTLDIPYVLTEHSSFYHQGLVPEGLYPRVKQAIRRASAYLVVSPRLCETLVEKLGDVASRAEYVANVIPPFFESDYGILSRRVRNGPKFIFLSVGNLLPIKGHEFLLRAFAELAAGRENVALRILGDGPLRAELENLADDLEIGKQVFFAGEVSSERVKSEMLAADTLVLPSKFETFGVVLIEALACGLPVVSTDCGGPGIIVDAGSGVLVEPQNVTSLQEGMAWALEHVREMDPGKIREHVIERFGRSRFARKISKIYHQACSSNSAYEN